jgi:hypothetical protein
MATAYRRKDGVLVAQYKGADGKQHQERLGPEHFKNLRDAKRHAQTLEDAASTQFALLEGRIGKAATFETLICWWDANYAAKGRSRTEAGFLKKHACATLGPLRVHEVTSGVIEGLLVKKEALGPDGQPELSPKSINNLRELIGRVFSKAIEQEMWKVLPRTLDGGDRVSLVGGHRELERGARTRADGHRGSGGSGGNRVMAQVRQMSGSCRPTATVSSRRSWARHAGKRRSRARTAAARTGSRMAATPSRAATS